MAMTPSDNYKNWIEALEKAGIPALSLDTCCKLLAIVHSCAIEEFVFHGKLSVDIAYAQRRCRVGGALQPDTNAVPLIRKYVQDMERAPDIDDEETMWAVQWPQWATQLMKERYDIVLPKQRIA